MERATDDEPGRLQAEMGWPRMRVDAVELALRLVALDTIAPPGSEAEAASAVAGLLREAGFAVRTHEFAPGRASLVARLEGREPALAPLVFTGHLDTVPLGTRAWTRHPFGEIGDKRLFGRGASDMKGGVAAFLAAMMSLDQRKPLARGIEAVITAGEETGCLGARDLARLGLLGKASGLIIAEPTSNRLAIAHKGALHLRAHATGRTAHGSMPDAGSNAIERALQAIGELRGCLPPDVHPLLGQATATVTTIGGGEAVNVVPDRCDFTIDIRTVPGQSHADLLRHLRQAFGSSVEIEAPLADLPAVATPADEPFVQALTACLGEAADRIGDRPIGMPYFTDGSVLQGAYGGCPTVIIGPGEAVQAHQTDEWCSTDAILAAQAIYTAIIARWCGGDHRQ